MLLLLLRGNMTVGSQVAHIQWATNGDGDIMTCSGYNGSLWHDTAHIAVIEGEDDWISVGANHHSAMHNRSTGVIGKTDHSQGCIVRSIGKLRWARHIDS